MPQVSFNIEYLQVRGSSPEKVYVVTLLGGAQPVSCTCPSFEHRDGPLGTPGGCKHMRGRVGPESVGTTRCANCRSMLTLADFDHDALMAVAAAIGDVDGAVKAPIRCMRCV